MAFPRLSASMLLASLILLLYWTTVVWSYDRTSADLPPPYRVKRELQFRTREKVTASLTTTKDILSATKEAFSKKNLETASRVMKGLAKVANLAPGIGVLVSSFINVALAFIGQENPLKELREGFSDLNRRLDSLSIQISNLATDVEWFNYVSVYSQDEVRILNSWKKFDEFRKNSEFVKSEDDELRLAEILVNYYDNTATEASVANLYHYLTVSDTSLSGNLNDLLRKKFKCDIHEIGKYNLYLSSLLWKGMVLNQLYWNLIGFNHTGKESEHIQMSKTVYTAQISAINSCLNNYQTYLRKDVEEVSKALSPDDKTAIAKKVKTFLDKKYNWYNWVVLVYDTNSDPNPPLYNVVAKVPGSKISVAVGYTQKGEEVYKTQVQQELSSCYQKVNVRNPAILTGPSFYSLTLCNSTTNQIQQCTRSVAGVHVTQLVKVMYASYGGSVQVPEALESISCYDDFLASRNLYIYYSQTTSPCSANSCDRGECKRLLDSNEHRCECPYSYQGDRCEEKLDPRDVPVLFKDITVPDISTINAKLKVMDDKLKVMEDKLDAVLKNISPAQ